MVIRFLHSLRTRLILLTVLVEIVMISAIVWNSERLAEAHLVRQFELRRAEISLLLQAAIAPAMVQRDYASISETLSNASQLQGFKYLRMLDETGQTVASAGEQSTDKGSRMLDFSLPVMLEGRNYGQLNGAIDLGFLEQARQEMLSQNFGLALIGILLSSLILGAIALWLTSRLAQLVTASHRLAEESDFTPLPVKGRDDLAQVICAFNQMAQTIAKRVQDLRTAESRQRALASAIDTERSRLDALLSAMREGLVFVDQEERICYLNPAFAKLWLVSLDGQTTQMPLADLCSWLAASLREDARAQLFKGGDHPEELTLKDGRIVTQQGIPVSGTDRSQLGYLWIFEDVTSQRQMNEHLVFMAERDPLTKLANRARFNAELEQLVAAYQRDKTQQGAVLYLDLDEFKAINDSFGHRAGDKVLQRAADAIGNLVRINELFARLGGDEFAIIAPGADQHGACRLAERIVQSLTTLSFEFEGRRIGLTCSLGIALLPEHASRSEELVSRADAAMYQAKRSGKNCWRIYRPDLDESASMLSHLGWNEKIQSALTDNRFVLHFQGIHDALTRKISHYEVLIRMLDAEKPSELLLPGSFIPAAERTGRIVDIDRWVVQAAIEKLAHVPDLPSLAVNVSARTFDDPMFTGIIRKLLTQHQVAPRRLIIELTETAALANIADAERFIADLRQLGCTVCLDDFGVGFSSFAYLKHLSADVLKIDGMFIRNLLNSREDRVFVQAIVEVARGLGKKTVAEMGVDYAQGYHLSFPIAEISAP